MSKSHKIIAEFICNSYEQAVFMTAAKLGEAVGISESTVVRFASSLGFNGYPEFQKTLEDWVKGQLNSVSKMSVKYGSSSQKDIVQSVIQADIEKLKDTINTMDSKVFETAVETILNAKTIYIIGLRSCQPLASFLSFYLNMVLGHVVQLQTTSTTELFEQMIQIDDKDVLIGISFPRYSMRTLKAMEFASDRNAKVIAITDAPHSPVNMYSSCHLLAKSDMFSVVDSLVAPLSLINALVVSICLKEKVKVRENLEMLETTWNNYQVYLNDEINFVNEEPILSNPLTKGEQE
jgi:DNA-binding MurR/RpiR family transcriptional regulator